MPDYFPELITVNVKDAPPASILEIRRSGQRILALATDHIENGDRSLVILNGNFHDHPSVVFVNNWRNIEGAVCYNQNVRFEIGIAAEDMEPSGHKWGDIAGVLVLIKDQIYIHAASFDSWGSATFVNIKTGSILSQPHFHDVWHFASWRLWIRDPRGEHSFELLKFSANKQA